MQWYSMGRLAGLVALGFCATPALSQSIEGQWGCFSSSEGSSIASSITFTKTGRMLGDLFVIFNVPGREVLARVDYGADYAISGAVLVEEPKRADIKSFTDDGRDVSTGPNALALQQGLLSTQSSRADIIWRGRQLTLDYGEIQLNCTPWN